MFCSTCSKELSYDQEEMRLFCPRCRTASAVTPNPAKRVATRQKTLKLKSPEPSEADIQKAIMRVLSQKGWLTVRFNSGGFSNGKGRFYSFYRIIGLKNKNNQDANSGLPDVLAFRGTDDSITNENIMVEVKDKNGKLRPSQHEFIRFAARFGVVVHVCTSWQEVLALIESVPDKN